ncbi:reverse transcriptase N-terminal domain-containing protein [Wolbachia endosymbiont of Cylisticus convexus]|uniref:reverse transcriptase N-terminal domain-containing protein n=1 Tax=Wolbachia endosymbiont of Cylisticus convexus TaxID=118728 RepID=UPI0021034C04|nr:reverse transcriptase N-terminal domain-containing protein [Wolbachia endosymbiont of Cylisticus convexus]
MLRLSNREDGGKVKALQHLLTRSFSGKALAVKRVTGKPRKKHSGCRSSTMVNLQC